MTDARPAVARADSALLLDLAILFDKVASGFDTAFTFAAAFERMLPDLERALLRPVDGRRFVGPSARLLMLALGEIMGGSPDAAHQAHMRAIGWHAAQLVRAAAFAALKAERGVQ